MKPIYKPVNKDAAMILSRKTVPACTIHDALKLIGANIAGEITLKTVEETLSRGLQAEYTVRVKKCSNKPGHNVIMTYKERTDGFAAAHFTDLV